MGNTLKKREFIMLRKCVFSMAVILLLTSGTHAAIGHAQSFSFDALNIVKKTGCIGSAEGSTSVMVGHTQKAYNTASGIGALQKETAVLTQSGSSAGIGNKAVVIQKGSAEGEQEQFAGVGFLGNNIQSESQSLGVNLDMVTINTKGIGSAAGTQDFVGAQKQIQITPNGMSKSLQNVNATQSSTISGSLATVKNILNVVLNQNQGVVEGK
jgi:hypothetical protein